MITRIMATVANDRCRTDFVRSLCDAGMTGVRINSAHVSPDGFRQMVATLRSVDPSLNILMDTKGPEVRTTALPSPLELQPGSRIRLASGTGKSSEKCIYVAVERLADYVSFGSEILIDDGEVVLTVLSVTDGIIEAEAVNAAILGSRKTVAITGAELPPLPAVSERDRENIAAAVECGIDMIAHSFVRSRADVEAVRALIDGSPIRLFSKIECREAVENLDEILEASDGILVARGDLGTHIPLPDIPTVQLRAVLAARRIGKPTILATQMLQSMISRPSPTRAELSDIALAVMEGFDWLLLTGETAVGQYPAECVAMANLTAESAENNRMRCIIN